MQESWNPVRRRCVNCGSEVVGYRNEKECVKLRCPKCGLVMVSKRMSRRRERIDIFVTVDNKKMIKDI